MRRGMGVFGFGRTAARTPRYDARVIAELGRAGDQGHGVYLALKLTHRTHDFEGKLRNAIAEFGERQTLEDDIGEAAIGGCVLSLMSEDETVGELIFAAAVEPPGHGAQVELLAIGPDA